MAGSREGVMGDGKRREGKGSIDRKDIDKKDIFYMYMKYGWSVDLYLGDCTGHGPYVRHWPLISTTAHYPQHINTAQGSAHQEA
jgi:hypothetical protein